MKDKGLAKAAEMAGENGAAAGALSDIPETPMGPPEDVSGGMPEFDEATGLPLIAADKVPEGFPPDHGDLCDDEDDLFL